MTDALPDLGSIRLGDRPLAVFDVDDVVLQFILPFIAYLGDRGLKLEPRSFRLHGNILDASSGEALDDAAVSALILDFFDHQEQWQTPFAGTVSGLHTLSRQADIVFLTAMPPLYQDKRRRLLDLFDLPYPLIATESPKGPVVQQLHGKRPLPLAFVDDMVRNLESVAEHAPQSLRLHMVPRTEIHRHAPRAPATLAQGCSLWPDIAQTISRYFEQAP